MESEVGGVILIKNDGTIDPWGLKMMNSSRIDLLPPTRENTEEIDGVDGEEDFGTELDSGDWELICFTPAGMTRSELLDFMSNLAAQLHALRNQPDMLVWESDQNKGLYVRMGTPKEEDLLELFSVNIPLRYQPIWVSVIEHTSIGSGTLTNAGTFETPVKISIRGPVVNPLVTIGGKVLQYTGTLAAPDLLEIDTDAVTVKLNGANAQQNFTVDFPKLQAGDTAVVAPGTGTTTFTWRDRWI
ncbi:MAG: hypothetical protein WA118_08350 [Carboxydocellales bacterium]